MARIGIDLDGVIYDFVEALRSYVLKTEPFASNYTAEELVPSTRWEFYLDWGMTLDEFLYICAAGVNSGHIFFEGEPLDDARNQLQRLRDADHEIIIITDRTFGRPGQARQNTLSWLLVHDIPYDEIHFTADKASIQVDAMIDDKPENYEALYAAGVNVILRARPWNKDRVGMWTINSLEGFVTDLLMTTSVTETAAILADPNAMEAIAEAEAEPRGEVRMISSTGGEKGSKLARYDLIPAGPLHALAELYGAGAEKYAARNWERGYDWSLSFAAMQRHAWQFWNGEDTDTQPPNAQHLAAVVFHAFALLEFMQTHREFDNRPSTIAAALSATESAEAA